MYILLPSEIKKGKKKKSFRRLKVPNRGKEERETGGTKRLYEH